jgi:hypothetical protein
VQGRSWELGVGSWAFYLGFIVFALLATANGAGYRYGSSDQAFYIPVVVRALQPAAFPHDASLIDSQGRLMLTDDIIAAIIRVTGLPLDWLFFAAYVLSVLLLWIAVTAIGRRLFASAWLTVAFAAAMTLRHRIPSTTANSFEPYFHPRMLAFGVGALAVAAVLRRRFWLAVALVAISSLAHVTTGLWFAIMIGVAIAHLDRRFRLLAVGGTAAVVIFLIWAGVAGPLRSSFVTMDPPWLEAVALKDLFAWEWPLWSWVSNLGLIVVAWAAYRWKESRPELGAIVWGAAALIGLFLVSFPLVRAKLAFPVQLQISRVFWLVDFVTLICLIGVVRRERTAKIVAAILVAAALGRGIYVMTIEHPERPLVAVHLPASDWDDAMKWIKAQSIDVHVLADPGHAWKYGTSVRVAAERDVFLEEVKDSAVAIYSRDVAGRFLERVRDIPSFDQLSVGRARELALLYDLDYLVAEKDLPMPVVYKNRRFKVYQLEK